MMPGSTVLAIQFLMKRERWGRKKEEENEDNTEVIWMD